MYDGLPLRRFGCTSGKEPAGLTPGRPDEGVWAYVSRRDEGAGLRVRAASFAATKCLDEGMGSTYS
jgi:hypothetical protein